MGVICCMWLGARRGGHALLSALAYPACGAAAADAAARLLARRAGRRWLVGAALWLGVVPLRLRGACVLLVGGRAARARWRPGTSHGSALSDESVAARATRRGRPRARRAGARDAARARARRGAIALPDRPPRAHAACAPARGSVLLRAARRSPCSRSWRARRTATAGSPAASPTPSARSPTRMRNPAQHARAPDGGRRACARATGRRRCRYSAPTPLLGAGAEGYATARLRYRTRDLVVGHAHGFIVQTLADLGVVGLLLVLALLVSWMLARARRHARGRCCTGAPTAPSGGHAEHALRRGRVRRPLAHRLDLVRARATPAWRSVCAGWLAGRGSSRPQRGPARAALARRAAGAARAARSRARARWRGQCSWRRCSRPGRSGSRSAPMKRAPKR